MDGDDEGGIDPAIAAAMGFTGFGAQPSKRRKYNDGAMVEGQIKEPRVQKSGSGANNTSLGIRKNPNVSTEDTANFTGELVAADETVSAIEQRKPKGKKAKQAAPTGLAAFLSLGRSLPNKPPPPAPSQSQETPVTSAPLNSSDAPLTHRPLASPAEPGNARAPEAQTAHDDISAYRRGVRNDRGDMVYFLPSFIEDPWKSLKADNK